MKKVDRACADGTDTHRLLPSTRDKTSCMVPAGKTLLWLLIGLLTVVTPISAQNQDREDAGFVSLSGMDSVFADEPIIEINIHGALLRLVAEASSQEDAELASLLRRIRGVYVRGFNLKDADLEDVRRYRDRLSAELEQDGWNTFVRVRERDEEVNFYVRLRGDEMEGIIVMSVNLLKGQAVFLNIVGNIDPEQIGRIGRKFGVNGMSEF